MDVIFSIVLTSNTTFGRLLFKLFLQVSIALHLEAVYAVSWMVEGVAERERQMCL